jgi:putative Mg2+ transporter-C (MgtC) family protein
MPITLQWHDIALRLMLTVFAGTLIGFNRGEHGRPAGLRTTLLVCLAASFTMILANLLLGMRGRPSDSFVTFDVMRLPLGILSGMGFIGGGAILRRDNMVLGVTTAATLWFVTVMGLCFGGGQHVLGLIALALGMVVLSGLKWLETLCPHEYRGTLVLTVGPGGPPDEEIRRGLLAAAFQIDTSGFVHDRQQERHEVCFELRWRQGRHDPWRPDALRELAERPGIERVQWTPQELPSGVV